MSPWQVTLGITIAAIAGVVFAAVLTPLAMRAPPHAAVKTDQDEAKPIRVVPIARSESPPALPGPRPDIPTSAPPPAPMDSASPAAPAPIATVEPPIAEAEPESKYRWRRNASGDNICTRTGGWKVEIRGGKSWRCAYRR